MNFQFDSFSDFLAMGGYGEYVWSVYGLFAVFILVNVVPTVMKRKSILRQLAGRQKREVNR